MSNSYEEYMRKLQEQQMAAAPMPQELQGLTPPPVREERPFEKKMREYAKSKEQLAKNEERLVKNAEKVQKKGEEVIEAKREQDVDDLKQAIMDRESQQRTSNLMKNFESIGQAIAGGQTGNFEVDQSYYDDLDRQAKDKIESIKDKRDEDEKKALRDPKSDISAYARELASKSLGRPIPDNISAAQLEQLGINTRGTQTGNKRFQFQRVFDPATNQVKLVKADTATGEISPTDQIAGFSTQFKTDPRTGEVISLNPALGGKTGQITGPESEKPKEEPKEVDYTYQMLNKRQQDGLKDAQTSFQKEMKDARDFGEILDNVSDLVTADISAAIPAIKRQLARSVGKEVGVMTDKDVEAFSGDQSLIGALTRFAKMTAEGTMTEEDKKQYNQIIAIARRNLSKAMDIRSNYYTRQLKQRLPDASMNSLKQLMLVDESKPGRMQPPHGDIVERKGKTYKWNPVKGKYQLFNKGE